MEVLAVHIVSAGYAPEFDRQWPMEIGPEGASVPEYKAYVSKKLEEAGYGPRIETWPLVQARPTSAAEDKMVESSRGKEGGGEATAGRTEAGDGGVKR